MPFGMIYAKKTFLTIISLIAVFAILSTGTAFAASAIAHNSSIGAENAVASAQITLEKAKAIAVNHAGLSMSGVTFSKAKLDTDDGNTIYDIEFYKDGIEYEYEIDASSGKILEYDAEHDD